MHGIDSRYCTLAESCSNIIIHYTDLMWYEYLIICCLLMNIHVWYFFSQIIIFAIFCLQMFVYMYVSFHIIKTLFWSYSSHQRKQKGIFYLLPAVLVKGTQVVLKWSIVNKDFIITFFLSLRNLKMVENSKAVFAFLFTMHTYYKDRQNLSNKDKFS